MKTPELTSGEIIERAHAVLDVLAGKREPEALQDLVTEAHELVQSGASLYKPVIGPERFGKLVRWYRNALSEWTVTLKDERVDHHVCFVRAEVSVKHTGQLGLIAPTNREVTFGALASFETIGSKVCRTVLFFDGIALMRQLSALSLVDPFPQGTSHG